MKRLILLLTFILGIAASSLATDPTGTISWTQNGSEYTYTITLKAGSTTIGDFFFAWTDDGRNFLPTVPSAEGNPPGWTNSGPNNNGTSDGYGINWSTSTPLAAGQSLTGFTFTTKDTPAKILADSPFYPGTPVTTSQAYVTVEFGAKAGNTFTLSGPASLTAISMNPAGVLGGMNSVGTLTLGGKAGSNTTVTLISDNAAVVVPASATVLSGSTSGTFKATTKGVNPSITAHITASLNGVSKVATLVVNKASLATLSAYGVTSISGGATINAYAALNGLAPSATLVALHSSNSLVLTVPASVTIPAGVAAKVFPITTKAVSTNTTITIIANYSGISKTLNLIVSNVRLNYLADAGVTTVTGGKKVSASAVLTAVPTSNVTVTLRSSSTKATVPASVIVKSGTQISGFLIDTLDVTVPTQVTITGTYAAVSKTLTITLEPGHIAMRFPDDAGLSFLTCGNLEPRTVPTTAVFRIRRTDLASREVV